jgi:monofunctional biosynthetic peptidoglycan transglycosylase
MRALLTAVMIATGANLLPAQEPMLPLLDFTAADAAGRWQAVNDGVMGGVSVGRFRITGEKTLEFSGNLSLDNNGGFASVRTRPTRLDIRTGDTLVLLVQGDGREYLVNIHTTSRRMAFSYRARLPTTAGQWCEVRIPLDQFEPTSFGQVVPGMGPVQPDQINGLGIMLSDKKPGPFAMEIESVKVIRRASAPPAT